MNINYKSYALEALKVTLASMIVTMDLHFLDHLIKTVHYVEDANLFVL